MTSDSFNKDYRSLLVGKRVVVTGGAGLLGAIFCSEIVKFGGFVIVADKNLSAASDLARELNLKRQDSALAVYLDITNQNSLKSLISSMIKKLGGIDGVVNNAYPKNENYGKSFEEVQYNDFCENISLHLGGYFLVMQQFGLLFRTQGYGSIVNMGSVYGFIPPRLDIYEGTAMTMPVEYAAIKAGVHQLTRYFAQHLKKDGVRVNTLSPGGIEDGQPESFVRSYSSYSGTKGMLNPQDIAGALIFLLSESSNFVTGQNITVDDGFSL